MMKTIRLRIRRQEGPGKRPYWEEFSIPWQPGMNVVACLMEIRKNPVNARGKATTPVVWESNCLEEVCGACSMKVNGVARQACSALVDGLRQPIVLEPLSSFPVVRDLAVDRSAMFERLKKVQAWVEVDGSHPLGPGPRHSENLQAFRYELSRCMTCGVCLEACPNYHRRSPFMGPQPLAQVLLFNLHPSGALTGDRRLEAIMGPDGILGCGQAQNCVRSCPKGVPLTRAISVLQGETVRYALRRWASR